MSQEEKKAEEDQVEKENIDIFIEFINEKWTESKKCPICGENTWSPGWYVTRNDPVRPTAMKGTYLYTHVSCRSCGYTLFFNAVRVGIEEAIIRMKKEDSSE